MSKRTIRLVRTGFPDRMALDTAVSRVLLTEASAEGSASTLRLFAPGRSVAFGKHDAVVPGYAGAVAAARESGFEPFLRLAGGRAAAFHEQTVAISWTMPSERPIEGIRERFSTVADLLVRTFESLGIPAAVGAVPGEYCQGEFSVHVGTSKVAGIGQRLTRSAAHIGGVVVVDGGDTVRRALVPVYEALDLDWDPATAGALSDTVSGLAPDAVIDAIVRLLGLDAGIVETTLPAETIDAAEALAAGFTAR